MKERENKLGENHRGQVDQQQRKAAARAQASGSKASGEDQEAYLEGLWAGLRSASLEKPVMAVYYPSLPNEATQHLPELPRGHLVDDA